MTLDVRHRVETDFHDGWARAIDLDDCLVRETFEAPTVAENAYACARLEPLAGRRVLDLGCGAGEAAAYFALAGARVVAVDLSAEMLGVARRLARRHRVAVAPARVAAERLPFASGSFDRVFGNGVLHHVDLAPALDEIRRVMAPGGVGVFVEPLRYNPLLRVYRRIARDVHTPTERALTFRDLAAVRARFRATEHREFQLLTLGVFLRLLLVDRLDPRRVRYWKHVIVHADRYAALYRRLAAWDARVLSALPWLRRLCYVTVITVRA
jgi:SAM-dependent methyltransferase